MLSGNHTLIYSAEGYKSETLSVSVPEDTLIYRDIYLKPKTSDYLIFAYPNPFFTTTDILIYLIKNEEVNLAIFNLLGQKVYEKKIPAGYTGLQDISFPMKNIPNGNYFLRCQTYSGILYLKLVKL